MKQRHRRQDIDDFIEPHIFTQDTVIIPNYLSESGTAADGGIVATFRPEHLKNIEAFKARLNQEKRHHLLVSGTNPLDMKRIQSLKILEMAEEDAENSFEQIKAIPPQKALQDYLAGASANEEQVQEFFKEYRRWPVEIRKLVEFSGTAITLASKPRNAQRITIDGSELDFEGTNIKSTVVDVNGLDTPKRKSCFKYITALKALGHIPDKEWNTAYQELGVLSKQSRSSAVGMGMTNAWTSSNHKWQLDKDVRILAPEILSTMEVEVYGGIPRAHRVIIKQLLDKNIPNAIESYQSTTNAITRAGQAVHRIQLQQVDFPEMSFMPQSNTDEDTQTSTIAVSAPVEDATTDWQAPKQSNPSPSLNELLAYVDVIAKDCLNTEPAYNALRCHLNLQPGHPVTISLTDKDEHTRSFMVTLNEPDLENAIKTKKEIQSHLLNTPGIIPYRKRFVGGEYIIGWEDPIPNSPPLEAKIVKSNGIYRLQMTFDEDGQKLAMGFSLGLQQQQNYKLAEQRMHTVLDFLAEQRSLGQWVTKGDAAAHLRTRVNSWENAQRMEVDGFERNIFIPFPADGSQTTKLRIGTMHMRGDPNPTWVLPIQLFPNNGLPIGIDLPLHISDENVAQQRAAERINSLISELSNQPANAKWAVDDINRLQRLTPAERSQTHNVDAYGLRDIFNDLPHYKDDLAVRIVEQKPQGNKIIFKLGIIRGANVGLGERVREKEGRNPAPVEIARPFSVSASSPEVMLAFERSVNATFHKYIHEEYSTRTDASAEPDGIPKRKAPTAYNPKTAPLLLDDAVQTQLNIERNFPDVMPMEPPRISGGRGNWRITVGQKFNHHEDCQTSLGDNISGDFTDRYGDRDNSSRPKLR
jgi:hypothetical protein